MLQSVKEKLEALRCERGRDLEIGDVVDYSPNNPTLAEIVPGVMPRWHVIETHPNRERIAAAHLIARRFGVFVPEKDETIVRRGRRIDQTSLMFRGYIFIFVWGINQHFNRIKAVPGFSRIVTTENPDGSRKPAVLTDEQIDQIRAVENRERPLPAIVMPEHMMVPKKKGRWRKNQKSLYYLAQEQLKRDSEVVRCRPWSAFEDGLMTLDSDGRNQTLRTALGLAA